MILGHADEEVVAALQEVAAGGTSFGAPTELEIDLAQEVINAVPSIEMVRMVSSGTEATMSAIRLARGITGRTKLVKFEGCYHGHADSLLVKAGSGVATLGLPDSPGVPAALAQNTITVPFNNAAALERIFGEHNDIAAVIIEPVVGNMGCVPPQPGYLEAVRKLTKASGTLLIFDEVMTGFRLARVRYLARHHDVGKDNRRWAAGRCLRRQSGNHEQHRARRSDLPGRHFVRKSSFYDRRTRDATSSARQLDLPTTGRRVSQTM
jgi:glutamate-1-semialdehyde 2,1-aminomutase